jgi:type IV pilus assembly protein PilY1
MPQHGELTSDLMGVPTQGKLPQLTLQELPNGMRVCGTQILGKANNPTVRQEYAKQLVGLIRADIDSCRETKRLGAIFHSTPAIHTNMNSLALTDPSFQLYQNEVTDRPSVLYTSTHDGQIHAFRIDRGNDIDLSNYGEELWSYIPNFVLPRLNILSDRFDFILDGIPTIRDVLLYKDDPGTPAEILKDRWRSILIVPGGFRTSGMVAMDVTEPAKPALLWEISPNGRCSPDDTGVFRCYNALLPENSFTGLGFVRGKVDIGTVFVQFEGRAQERSVAIFGGGDAIPGSTNSGKAVFVIDIETGKVIKKFIAGGSDVIDTNSALGGVKGIDFNIVGTPTCYNTFPGTVMTRCLIGDAGGQLWHLRFSGSNSNDWKLHFFHDAYNIKEGEPTQALTSANRRPIWEAPAVALHPDGGRLVVAYHTSQIDDLRRLNTLPPRMISVLEDMVLDDDGRLQEIKATTNWVKYFTESEGIPTGPPLIYDRSVYQTSYVNDSTDMCLVGEGLLWGHHYLGDDGTSINDVRPTIDSDGDPVTPEKSASISLGEGVPYGVQILSRPSCAGDAGISAETSLDQVGPSKLELVIQTTGGSFTDDQLPASGDAPSITRVTRELQQLGSRVFLNSWGNLLE